MKVTNTTVAVITGAASGIGAELARTLVRRGAQVALGDVNIAGLEKLAAELGANVAPTLAPPTLVAHPPKL
jgi:NADP-dependent 3-hydroxy acid dehydrogenase YdfG